VLIKIGAVGLGATGLGQLVRSTEAFSSITASRDSDLTVASEENGIVGIVGQGPVQKNQRESMVKFTNNATTEITITVTLDNPGDGTLYNNEGNNGTSVTFTLPPGNSQPVDIEATIQGTIPYSVSVDSEGLGFSSNKSVEAVGGNANNFVRVYNLQDFQANSDNNNNWTLNKAQAQDRDGDKDLDRIEYEITDSTGTLRASRTVNFQNPKKQYQAQDLTFSPDDAAYDLPAGEKYTLTATGYDVDGNFGSDTVTATSVGSGGPSGGGGCTIGSNNNPSVFQFNNLQNFSAKQGPDRWDLGQVNVQDSDGDNDLNKLKFEITDSSGATRATKTVSISGQQYQDQNLKINPDDPSYDVPKGETYTLTVTVCDSDGNSKTQTRQSTA